MTHQANPGGKGPKVTKQTGNKGPIIGKMSSPAGTTKPWDLNRGSNKPGMLKGNKSGPPAKGRK